MRTNVQLAKGAGLAPTFGDLVFFTNSTSNPDLTLNLGGLKKFVSSIVYSATGIYTITFTTQMWPFCRFSVSSSFDAVGNRFSVGLLGAYNSSTRTLQIQAFNAAGATAPAANAANFITVIATANVSGGG